MTLPNWSAILDSPGPGKPPYQNLSNAVRVLQHDPQWTAAHLWYDEFADRVMGAFSSPREWRDEDDVALTVYIQETTGLDRVPKTLVRDAVTYVARQRSRHPVRAWLQSLTWDQIDRLELAFEDGWGVQCDPTHPADYVRAASRNFFVSLVARVLQPGSKVDTMPVFEGPEGLQKSAALDCLGGAWYAAIDQSVETKDFLQALRGKWLIEIAELQAFTRADQTHVKSMLSRRIDTYRPSYGSRTIDVPRQCVFAGTANQDDWSRSDTGDRRFWPVPCGPVALDLIADRRDQWFAEALARYTAGATWWQMPGTTTQVQADRLPDHAWTLPILEGLLFQAETTMIDVLTRILGIDKADITRQAELTVGSILRRAGWVNKPARRNGILRRIWIAPPTP
jgi:putative DNA primase/helicase